MAHYRDFEYRNERGWRMNIGVRTVEIRSPEDRIKKMLPSHWDILGMSEAEWCREDDTTKKQITPAAIAAYLDRVMADRAQTAS